MSNEEKILLDEDDTLRKYMAIEEARKNALFEHDTWILPANPNDYEVDEAFRRLWVIEWAQTRALKNIKLNDIAYIYESSPVKAIRWKCRVVRVKVENSEIDDRRFSHTDENYTGPFIWLEGLREYDVGKKFSYETLRENGLKSTVRSPMRAAGQLLDYLEAVDEMVDRNEHN